MAPQVVQGFFPGGRPRRAGLAPGAPPSPPVAARPAVGPPPPASGPIQPRVGVPHGGDRFSVDPSVLRKTGPGTPLPETILAHMQTALGGDFRDVRIHVGPQAERIGAIAFTAGSDIFFAPGRFAPDTADGRRLLGHELAHVLQQRAGRVRGTPGMVTVVQDMALEAEADRAGVRAGRPGATTIQQTPAAGAGRDPCVQAVLLKPLPRRPKPPSRRLPSHLQVHRDNRPLMREDNVDEAYFSREAYSDRISLIHRTEPEAGVTPGTVQMYLTIYDATTQGSGRKDIHATSDGGIKIINKTHDTLLNMGDPRRAFHYFETYREQNRLGKNAVPARPIIRSFEIPKWLHARITGSAISESQRGRLGQELAYNVDKERAPNQYGFGPAIRDEIERHGRGLVSYVDAADIAARQQDPTNGTVLDVDVLRRKLGMPTRARAYLPPMENAKARSPFRQAEHGAILSRLYDDMVPLVAASRDRHRDGPARAAFDRRLLVIHGRCFPSAPGYYGPEIAALVRREPLGTMSHGDLAAFHADIGAAATFSVVEQMVTEGFREARSAYGREPELVRSGFSKRQTFSRAVRPITAPPPPPPREKPSDEQIARLREAKRTRQERPAEPDTALSEWNLFGDDGGQ